MNVPAPGDGQADRLDTGECPISAEVSLAGLSLQSLKHGDTFAVFDRHGDVRTSAGGPEGVFHRDTRFLSAMELMIDGHRPLVLSSTVHENNATLQVDLTNPDLTTTDGRVLPRDTLHIVRSKFLWEDCCYERLGIRNFDVQPRDLRLSFAFACDFADLFEVRGQKRRRRGSMTVEQPSPNAVALKYHGLDGIERHTVLAFEPRPTELYTGRAVFDLQLEAGGRTSVFATVRCGEGPIGGERPSFFHSLRSARRKLRASTAGAASVETSNEIVNEALCRAMADLYMLLSDTEHGPYPYAGIPWFSTAFGRDGIITAIEMLWVDPAIARGVLTFLAETQARDIDRESDAEPGKILHEVRHGEMARLREVPFGRYYGSVDSTPLFVVLAGMYFERTGDLETVRALWPKLESALEWIDRYGDVDGDGFVEYSRHASHGLTNQGWKDSDDAVFHADGELARGPIALCEVQGYVYAAKRHASELARQLGSATLAATLEQQATSLRERFEESFWCDDLGCYALALDGGKRPCRVRTSNAGQVLFSGIAAPERARRVSERLLGQTFFCGWGVRTVAAGEARHNPMSYHNGSVWPHDNALIALGMSRFGLTGHACRLAEGMFGAAAYMDLRRLPELFCGFRRTPGMGPTAYPVSCAPQAWASAAPFALLQACLGMTIDHQARALCFGHPRLPAFVDEIVIRNLGVGGAHMDVALRRHGRDVAVSVLDKRGDADVVIIQ